MQTRYQRLEKHLAQRRQQAARAAEESVLQGVRERSRLCQCLETAVLESPQAAAPCVALVAETRQAWQTLAALDAHHEKVLREHLELASQALEGNDQARQTLLESLPRNLERRLQLCLQLEIAAGIDSPAEFAQARMQFQVSRLADAMHHKLDESRSRQHQLRDLQLAWYQAGPVPLASQEDLEVRFERAIAAFGSESAA